MAHLGRGAEPRLRRLEGSLRYPLVLAPPHPMKRTAAMTRSPRLMLAARWEQRIRESVHRRG